MDLVDVLRNMIQEKGYVALTELASNLVAYLYETEPDIAHNISHEKIMEIMGLLENEKIHRVEYANAETEDFRRKDLFYYNPDTEG